MILFNIDWIEVSKRLRVQIILKTEGITMAEGNEKKWKPIHEICIAQLSGSCVYAGYLQHWAEIYADGAIAPPKSIPDLINAFQHAENILEGQIKIHAVASAIVRLNEQLNERVAAEAVIEKTVCEVHGSIEHMQSVTGLCPVCGKH